MGDTALLTCVVTNQGSHSVSWSKLTKTPHGQDTLLSVNTEVATEDARVGLLHEEEGEVYVLVLSNLTVHDAGMYSCELSTQPPTRSRHELRVVSGQRRVITLEDLGLGRPGEIEVYDDEDDYDILQSHVNASQHQFDSCCLHSNVTRGCQGYCDLDTLYYRSSELARDDTCTQDLDKIYTCLADGRNHAPCCLASGVPELCSDLCTGGLMASITSSLVSQCHQYSAPILTCVAAGLQSIPR